jgi:hypothetical protein
MSRASAFTPEHARLMKNLREWARKQGGSVSALSRKQRILARPLPANQQERDAATVARLTTILGAPIPKGR